MRIKERKFETLAKYSMGHVWKRDGQKLDQTEKVAASQETGLLFAELCVKQAAPGGRIGIILPNGYLGNRGTTYLAFREWLLRHTRLAAVIGFPRFTFKKSGADVSASVVLLEKRKKPLKSAAASEDYPIFAGLVESVGWNLSSKTAQRIFQQDAETGAIVTDANNEPLVDADFGRVLADLRTSEVAAIFPWLTHGVPGIPKKKLSTQFSINDVLTRSDLSIDPKRWCARTRATREDIKGGDHFSLGDVFEIVKQSPGVIDKKKLYQYVEIQDTSDGGFSATTLRGWQLPSRARHRIAKGDLFVGGIWSSVGRWFLAGGENLENTLVSNGFHRLRLKPKKSDYLVDVLIGLTTEAYRIQARAFCIGSDGLAELPEEELLQIVLPCVTYDAVRAQMEGVVAALLEGRSTLAASVRGWVAEGAVPTAQVEPRKSIWVQV